MDDLHMPHQSRPAARGPVPASQVLLAALLLICLAPTLACTIALKGGSSSFGDQAIDDATGGSTLDLWEIELGVGEFLDQRVDLALSGDFSDAIRGTDLQNARFTSRYHFRRTHRFDPYAGGGLGWFRWSVPALFVIPEPFCFPSQDPFQCEVVGDGELAEGFFPYGVVGLDIHTTKMSSAIVETRFDFAKDDGPYDFDGFQINIGFRVRLTE